MKTNLLLLVVLAAAACGGKHKNGAEGGGPLIDTTATTGDRTDHSGAMIPPEKLDEVNRNLERRRMIVSRCLAASIETGEVPKNSRGKMTLEIVISPSGQVSKVEVVKSTIASKEVQGCVKRKVEETPFPQLPRQLETSYTYAMEAN